MIERELDILNRQGLLPPMPPALQEAAGEFEIEYDSPLSRAQRAEEASGFMRTLEISMQLSQARQDPSPLDWLNVDAAIPE
ncbi:phage head-tail adapter protein, partial [Enterococcus hirae]